MSSAVSSGIGTVNVPPVYRLVSPTVTVDATGGAVEVDGNSKFNTNIPLDKGMAITAVNWFVTLKANPPSTSYISQMQAQITEALARTKVALTDPIYVDNYFDEVSVFQSTAVGDEVYNRTKALERHVLRYPWLSVAQQLNLVHTELPIVGNGLKADCTCIIEYELLSLTADLRSYLATRLQIAGQA